jgi:Flp pilus assembly protein TadG
MNIVRRMISLLKSAAAEERGTVAVAFALSIVPLTLAAGAAIDYTRLAYSETFLQNQSDAAALAVAASKDPAVAAYWIGSVKSAKAAGTSMSNVGANGSWISTSDYRVEASAEVPLSLLAMVPGMSERAKISVTSVARVNKPKLTYQAPTLSDLDPEAADYNRIYVYCFNPTTKERTQETAIADNAGTKYSYTFPQCEADETMSYRLYNVRESRTNPKVWDKGKATRYNFYTDTVMKDGAETYDLGGYSILETVLCNDLTSCVGKKKGGVIPEGKGRTPVRSTEACAPGKYMYYGWEDRPPGLGWTDTDYDDIRIIIGCPVNSSSGKLAVWLVK